MSAETNKPAAPARDIAQLLDRAPPAGYREEWAALLARPASKKRGDRISTLVFRLGEEWLGLPTRWVTEVGSLRSVHSLPHRKGTAVAGIANVRGELLPCIALQHVLKIEASAAESAKRRLLVAGEGAKRIAFIADEVHGVMLHEEVALIPAPANTACVKKLLPWEKRTVALLEVKALSAAIERSLHE